jgi:ParB family chromosome partitioning protein
MSNTSGKSQVTELSIESISVGDRHRKDLGDIDGLARSMREVGLLHPLVVDRNHKLIAGHRRLEAAKKMGWRKVAVRVVAGLEEAELALLAERDENTCREDFTPSEAVALGKALEALEKARAKERQKHHGGTAPGKKKNTGGNLPQVTGGKTRDKVAEVVGLSGRTYEKAKAVVEAAEKDPERFGRLLNEMDTTGRVGPAYQEMIRRQVMLDGEGGRNRPETDETAADLRKLADSARRIVEALEDESGFDAAATVAALGRPAARRFAADLQRLGGFGAALFKAAKVAEQ